MKKKPKFYVDWRKKTLYIDGKAMKSGKGKTGYLNWIPVEVTYTPPVAVAPQIVGDALTWVVQGG